MHLPFSSIDELSQLSNRNFFLLDTLYFVYRLKFLLIFKGINLRNKGNNLDKTKRDTKKYCYFAMPIETNERSKEW